MTPVSSSTPPAGCRALALLDLALLVALVALALAWLLDPLRIHLGPLRGRVSWGPRPVIAVAGLTAARILLRRRQARSGAAAAGLFGRAGVRRGLLVLGGLIAPLLLFELALLPFDLPDDLPPLIIQGQDDIVPSPDKDQIFLPSAELRWVFNPGARFFQTVINRQGFVGREFTPQKPPGTRRVICLGCSCTAMGPPTYADLLQEQLAAAPPTPERWEAFNMGVHGYSIVQGRRLFELQTRALAPDVVTLYFGWNDHWRTASGADSALLAEARSAPVVALHRLFGRKRFVRFLIYAGRHAPRRAAQPAGSPLRVPPYEYRRVLDEFIDRIRAAGAVPIVITAPRAALTEHLVNGGQAESVADATHLHDDYARITREVALAKEALLVDLAATWDPETDAALFQEDGIHVLLPGRRLIADALYDVVGRAAASEPQECTGSVR